MDTGKGDRNKRLSKRACSELQRADRLPAGYSMLMFSTFSLTPYEESYSIFFYMSMEPLNGATINSARFMDQDSLSDPDRTFNNRKNQFLHDFIAHVAYSTTGHDRQQLGTDWRKDRTASSPSETTSSLFRFPKSRFPKSLLHREWLTCAPEAANIHLWPRE